VFSFCCLRSKTVCKIPGVFFDMQSIGVACHTEAPPEFHNPLFTLKLIIDQLWASASSCTVVLIPKVGAFNVVFLRTF
jgi:hypothetical protein